MCNRRILAYSHIRILAHWHIRMCEYANVRICIQLDGRPTAAITLSTLQAMIRAPMTTNTMLYACRAVSDVIRSCVMAWARGGHAGVELAALTATLITMSNFTGRNNTPDQPYPDQGQDYKSKMKTKSGAERC